MATHVPTPTKPHLKSTLKRGLARAHTTTRDAITTFTAHVLIELHVDIIIQSRPSTSSAETVEYSRIADKNAPPPLLTLEGLQQRLTSGSLVIADLTSDARFPAPESPEQILIPVHSSTSRGFPALVSPENAAKTLPQSISAAASRGFVALRRAITALAQGGPPPGANAHPLVSALNPSVTRGDLLLVGCTSGLDVDGGGAREVLGVTAMVAGLKMRPAQVRVGSHVELERVWKELVGAAEKVAAMELKLGTSKPPPLATPIKEPAHPPSENLRLLLAYERGRVRGLEHANHVTRTHNHTLANLLENTHQQVRNHEIAAQWRRQSLRSRPESMCDAIISSGLNPLYEGGMEEDFLSLPQGIFAQDSGNTLGTPQTTTASSLNPTTPGARSFSPQVLSGDNVASGSRFGTFARVASSEVHVLFGGGESSKKSARPTVPRLNIPGVPNVQNVRSFGINGGQQPGKERVDDVSEETSGGASAHPHITFRENVALARAEVGTRGRAAAFAAGGRESVSLEQSPLPSPNPKQYAYNLESPQPHRSPADPQLLGSYQLVDLAEAVAQQSQLAQAKPSDDVTPGSPLWRITQPTPPRGLTTNAAFNQPTTAAALTVAEQYVRRRTPMLQADSVDGSSRPGTGSSVWSGPGSLRTAPEFSRFGLQPGTTFSRGGDYGKVGAGMYLQSTTPYANTVLVSSSFRNGYPHHPLQNSAGGRPAQSGVSDGNVPTLANDPAAGFGGASVVAEFEELFDGPRPLFEAVAAREAAEVQREGSFLEAEVTWRQLQIDLGWLMAQKDPPRLPTARGNGKVVYSVMDKYLALGTALPSLQFVLDTFILAREAHFRRAVQVQEAIKEGGDADSMKISGNILHLLSISEVAAAQDDVGKPVLHDKDSMQLGESSGAPGKDHFAAENSVDLLSDARNDGEGELTNPTVGSSQLTSAQLPRSSPSTPKKPSAKSHNYFRKASRNDGQNTSAGQSESVSGDYRHESTRSNTPIMTNNIFYDNAVSELPPLSTTAPRTRPTTPNSTPFGRPLTIRSPAENDAPNVKANFNLIVDPEVSPRSSSSSLTSPMWRYEPNVSSRSCEEGAPHATAPGVAHCPGDDIAKDDVASTPTSSAGGSLFAEDDINPDNPPDLGNILTALQARVQYYTTSINQVTELTARARTLHEQLFASHSQVTPSTWGWVTPETFPALLSHVYTRATSAESTACQFHRLASAAQRDVATKSHLLATYRDRTTGLINQLSAANDAATTSRAEVVAYAAQISPLQERVAQLETELNDAKLALHQSHLDESKLVEKLNLMRDEVLEARGKRRPTRGSQTKPAPNARAAQPTNAVAPPAPSRPNPWQQMTKDVERVWGQLVTGLGSQKRAPHSQQVATRPARGQRQGEGSRRGGKAVQQHGWRPQKSVPRATRDKASPLEVPTAAPRPPLRAGGLGEATEKLDDVEVVAVAAGGVGDVAVAPLTRGNVAEAVGKLGDMQIPPGRIDDAGASLDTARSADVAVRNYGIPELEDAGSVSGSSQLHSEIRSEVAGEFSSSRPRSRTGKPGHQRSLSMCEYSSGMDLAKMLAKACRPALEFPLEDFMHEETIQAVSVLYQSASANGKAHVGQERGPRGGKGTEGKAGAKPRGGGQAVDAGAALQSMRRHSQ